LFIWNTLRIILLSAVKPATVRQQREFFFKFQRENLELKLRKYFGVCAPFVASEININKKLPNVIKLEISRNKVTIVLK